LDSQNYPDFRAFYKWGITNTIRKKCRLGIFPVISLPPSTGIGRGIGELTGVALERALAQKLRELQARRAFEVVQQFLSYF
jgi:hypothetical protein